MKTVVIKRNGCQVVFDKNRIKEAVMHAATATGICDDQYCASRLTTMRKPPTR